MKSASSKIVLFFLFSLFQNTILYSQAQELSEEADELYNSGKYEELISFCDTNLPFVIQKRDSLEVAKLLFGKAKGLYHKSRHTESLVSLEQAEKYLKNNQDDNALKADLYYFIHINYSIKSYILKELKYGEKSLELYENTSEEYKNYERILILYRRMANPNVTIGNYEVAVKYLDKAEELLDNIPSNYKLPNPLLTYKISLGYQKIVVDLIETAFFAENYDKISIEKITRRIEKEKEKQDLLYAENQGENINFHSYSSVLNFYCRYFIVNQDKIDFDLSNLHQDIDKSIKLLDKRSYQRFVHLYLGNKVDVYCYEKSYEQAMTLMNRIIQEAGEDHNRYVNFLIQKGGIFFKMGDNEQGRYWIKKGIDEIHSGTETLKTDYSNFEAGFKLEDTYLILAVANKIIEKSAMEESKKNDELSLLYTLAFKQFLNTYTDQPLNKRTENCFNKIVKNLIKYNCLDKVKVSQIEHVENRLAWKKFTQSRNIALVPVIDSLEQIDYRLRQQLVDAKKQRKLKQTDSIKAAIEKHQRQLRTTYPKLASFTQDNFEITTFQNKIDEDEIILKYMFFTDEFAVFQITKDSIQWDLYPWNVECESLMLNHLKQIQKPTKALQLSDTLTRILMPKSAFNYEKITIIPDHLIYQLPFETLKYNDRYLVESKVVRYSSHLRFTHIDNDNFDGKNIKNVVSIFAPDYPVGNKEYTTRSVPYYLEGAQNEAKVIKELFSAQSFIGDKATKEQFVTHKSESTVLHLAMHATIDKNNPEFSHFNFSNNEKLYLEELYGLKIPSELAVLSACNTGVGKVEAASGMVSLQRAFNFAGTKATIASLWEVPDKTTSHIMISFYEYLKKGKTKSKALQLSKEQYLNTVSNDILRHPYYWGGFVLYGDDEPVLNSPNLNILYGILIAIGVILLGGYVMRYRKT